MINELYVVEQIKNINYMPFLPNSVVKNVLYTVKYRISSSLTSSVLKTYWFIYTKPKCSMSSFN